MEKRPDAVFVLDTKKEHIAVTEANKLGIPLVAVVDTNCDPDVIQYVIPGNDDAIRSGTLMCRIIADAVDEGRLIGSKGSGNGGGPGRAHRRGGGPRRRRAGRGPPAGRRPGRRAEAWPPARPPHTGVPGKVDMPVRRSDLPHRTMVADAFSVTEPLSSTTIVPSLFGPPPGLAVAVVAAPAVEHVLERAAGRDRRALEADARDRDLVRLVVGVGERDRVAPGHGRLRGLRAVGRHRDGHAGGDGIAGAEQRGEAEEREEGASA